MSYKGYKIKCCSCGHYKDAMPIIKSGFIYWQCVCLDCHSITTRDNYDLQIDVSKSMKYLEKIRNKNNNLKGKEMEL